MSIALETFDAQQFREKLLAISAPGWAQKAESEEYRELATEFVAALADVFGSDLDRVTLWDRIDSAIQTSVAKCGGDLDALCSLAAEHVRADPGRAVGSPIYAYVLETCSSKTKEWGAGFLRYLTLHRFAVVIHGKRRWNEVKELKADSKRKEENGAN